MNHNGLEFPLAPFDRLNRVARWLSPLALVFLIIAIDLGTAQEGLPRMAPVAGILVVVILGCCYAFAPRAVRVSPEGLVIRRRLMPPLTFPWRNFTDVRRLEKWRGWKTFGCGGYYGYFGWYRLRDIGMVRLYATCRTDAVLLDGVPRVVVTVADTEKFMTALRRHLPENK